jgi:putative two-component system response regulator
MEEIQARVQTHLRLRQMQLELEMHNQRLEDLVRQKMKEIGSSRLATILAISALTEQRDYGTGRHIDRTRVFCRLLAKELKKNSPYGEMITESFIDNIFYAAPLHDIGKVGIPDHVLLKPGELTPEEFEIIKTHTLRGARTLEKVHAKYPHNDFVSMGISLTKYHHEKWDGTGYPEGLVGEDIPLEARIMAVADVYDALRHQRPYKESFSHEKSYAIVLEGEGKHFDPLVVEAFRSLADLFALLCERFG